jgi:hypothetical protein
MQLPRGVAFAACPRGGGRAASPEYHDYLARIGSVLVRAEDALGVFLVDSIMHELHIAFVDEGGSMPLWSLHTC